MTPSDDLNQPMTVTPTQRIDAIEGQFLDDDWLDEVIRHEAAKAWAPARSTRRAARLH